MKSDHQFCRPYFGNISIPLFTQDHLNELRYNICSERCKPDCNTGLYFRDINKMSDLSYFPYEAYILNIQPGSIPDIIVRHSFEMTLMSFVCNFGGLLGMWLGFSVLSISKHIFESIRRLYSFNGNKINLFMNNNLTTFKHKFNQKFFINKSNTSTHQKNLPMVGIN